MPQLLNIIMAFWLWWILPGNPPKECVYVTRWEVERVLNRLSRLPAWQTNVGRAAIAQTRRDLGDEVWCCVWLPQWTVWMEEINDR